MPESQKQTEENLSAEVFVELKAESTGLIKGLLNDIFGDFIKFLSILTTTAYWFYRPLGINSKEQQDPSSKFMNDIQLAKSLFFLLIIFLVIEGTSESKESYIWIDQGMFLVCYIFFLVTFIVAGKLWCLFARPSINNQRQFSACLMYQGCTLMFIQGILFGFFDLTVLENNNKDFNSLAFVTVFLIPYFHTLYFFTRLNQTYLVKHKAFGMIYAIVVVAIFLFFVSIVNEEFLSEGI